MGHADACGASSARPFRLAGRVRVHAEPPLSGLCVSSRVCRGSDDDGDTPAAAAQGNGGPVRETRVTTASAGHARSTQEDVWTSPGAFQAAVALSGDGPSRRMDGQRVPRGVVAAALASA